jgi:hypothetical protein
MWRRFWRKWTVDKPADFGDWLWDVFVVQFAAFLSRLTVRQVIAFIPVLILVFDDFIGQLYDARSSDFCPCPADS